MIEQEPKDEDAGQRKPKFTEKDLGKNPLALHLKIECVNMLMDGQYTYDRKGEVLINNEVLLEHTQATKLYADRERRLIVSKLSPRAKELLMWIMYEVKPGKDYLWINRVRFMDENDIGSVNTYKTAENELVSKWFLFHTIKTGVFWINPHYFFQGNRVLKFKDKVVEYKTKGK